MHAKTVLLKSHLIAYQYQDFQFLFGILFIGIFMSLASHLNSGNQIMVFLQTSVILALFVKYFNVYSYFHLAFNIYIFSFHFNFSLSLSSYVVFLLLLILLI